MLILASNAAAPAVRWNPKAPENTQVLPAFSFATLEPVLSAIGARYQRSGSAAKPELLVSFANNRKAVLMMNACEGESGCKALSIQSYWTPIANSPAERTAQAIDGFNQRYAFAKAYIAPDGRPALQRYLTADYGILRGNLAVNLLVFSRQADQFAADVLRPLEAKR
jgi:hypothetical protein